MNRHIRSRAVSSNSPVRFVGMTDSSSSSSSSHFSPSSDNDEYSEVREGDDPATLEKWKDTFALFDFEKTGTIATEDLGTLLRGLGKNLTEANISDAINEFDHDGSGRLSFSLFYRLMNSSRIRDAAVWDGDVSEGKRALAEKIKIFDTDNTGKIPAWYFVSILRSMGEPLTRDDVDNLMSEIFVDGDNFIDINQFVNHMFDTSIPPNT